MLRTILLVAILLAPSLAFAHGQAHTGCEANERLLGNGQCVPDFQLAQTLEELVRLAAEPGEVSIYIDESNFVATDTTQAIFLKPNAGATSWNLSCRGSSFTSTRSGSGMNNATLIFDVSDLVDGTPFNVDFSGCVASGNPATAQDIAIQIVNPTGGNNGLLNFSGLVVNGPGSQQVSDLGIFIDVSGTSVNMLHTKLVVVNGEGIQLRNVGNTQSHNINGIECETYYRCVKGAGAVVGSSINVHNVTIRDGSGFRFSKLITSISGKNTEGYPSDRGFIHIGDGGAHVISGDLNWIWAAPTDTSGLPFAAVGDVNQWLGVMKDPGCVWNGNTAIINSFEGEQLSAIDFTYSGGIDTSGAECAPSRPLGTGILTPVGNSFSNDAINGYGRLRFNSQIATYTAGGARFVDEARGERSVSFTLESDFPVATPTSSGFRLNTPHVMAVQCYTNDPAPAAATIKLHHGDDSVFVGDPTIVCGTAESGVVIYDHGAGGDTDFIDVQISETPLMASFRAYGPHATGEYNAWGYSKGTGQNAGLLHGDVIIFEVDGDNIGNACSSCTDIAATGGGQKTGDLFGALPLGASGAVPNGIRLMERTTNARVGETDGYGFVWRPLAAPATELQLWSESSGVNILETNTIDAATGVFDLRFKSTIVNDVYAAVTWQFPGSVNQNNGTIRWKAPTDFTGDVLADFIDGGKFTLLNAPFGEPIQRAEELKVQLVSASGITNGVTVVVTMTPSGDESAPFTSVTQSAALLAQQYGAISFRTPLLSDAGVELLIPDMDLYQIVAFDTDGETRGGITVDHTDDMITLPDNDSSYLLLWGHTLSDNGGNPVEGDALEFVVLMNTAGNTPTSPCASSCGTEVGVARFGLANNDEHKQVSGVGTFRTTAANMEATLWVRNENENMNLGFDTEQLFFLIAKRSD